VSVELGKIVKMHVSKMMPKEMLAKTNHYDCTYSVSIVDCIIQNLHLHIVQHRNQHIMYCRSYRHSPFEQNYQPRYLFLLNCLHLNGCGTLSLQNWPHLLWLLLGCLSVVHGDNSLSVHKVDIFGSIHAESDHFPKFPMQIDKHFCNAGL